MNLFTDKTSLIKVFDRDFKVIHKKGTLNTNVV